MHTTTTTQTKYIMNTIRKPRQQRKHASKASDTKALLPKDEKRDNKDQTCYTAICGNSCILSDVTDTFPVNLFSALHITVRACTKLLNLLSLEPALSNEINVPIRRAGFSNSHLIFCDVSYFFYQTRRLTCHISMVRR